MAIIDHEAELHRAGANITGLRSQFFTGQMANEMLIELALSGKAKRKCRFMTVQARRYSYNSVVEG